MEPSPEATEVGNDKTQDVQQNMNDGRTVVKEVASNINDERTVMKDGSEDHSVNMKVDNKLTKNKPPARGDDTEDLVDIKQDDLEMCDHKSPKRLVTMLRDTSKEEPHIWPAPLGFTADWQIPASPHQCCPGAVQNCSRGRLWCDNIHGKTSNVLHTVAQRECVTSAQLHQLEATRPHGGRTWLAQIH